MHNPSVEVFVTTAKANAKTKLLNIQRDIKQQKFPRWAPFKDVPACLPGADVAHGWTWQLL